MQKNRIPIAAKYPFIFDRPGLNQYWGTAELKQMGVTDVDTLYIQKLYPVCINLLNQLHNAQNKKSQAVEKDNTFISLADEQQYTTTYDSIDQNPLDDLFSFNYCDHIDIYDEFM